MILKCSGDGRTVTVSSREQEDSVVESVGEVRIESRVEEQESQGDTPTSGSLHVHNTTRQVLPVKISIFIFTIYNEFHKFLVSDYLQNINFRVWEVPLKNVSKLQLPAVIIKLI